MENFKINVPDDQNAPRIAMILNHPQREILSIEMIRDHIIRLCPTADVRIIESRSADRHSDILQFSPHLIFTYPFTSVNSNQIYYIYKYLLGSRIITHRAEGIVDPDSEILIKAMIGLDTYGDTLVDFELFWGKKLADVVGRTLYLQKKIISRDRIHYFGEPRFEQTFNVKSMNVTDVPLPDGLDEKIRQYNPQKILLQATNFILADYSREDLIRAGDIFDPRGENWEKELEGALQDVEDVKKFRQHCIENTIRVAEQNPDALIINKPHPIETIIHTRTNQYPYAVFNQYPNIFSITDYTPISNLIKQCSLFLHYGSSTALEAYMLQISDVLILPKSMNFSPKIYFGLGLPSFPSNIVVDIKDVPDLINNHFLKPMLFETNAEIEKYLVDMLNYTPSEKYEPSKKIAQFIIDSLRTPPLVISLDDPYLLKAVKTIGPSFIDILIDLGLVSIQREKIEPALRFFNDTWSISKLINLNIPNLHYARANILLKLGITDEATQAIELELKYFPENQQAKELKREIMSLTTVQAGTMVDNKPIINEYNSVTTQPGISLNTTEILNTQLMNQSPINNILSSNNNFTQDAINLWNKEKSEVAWHYILGRVEVEPDNKEIVILVSEELNAQKKIGDVIKILSHYLQYHPTDYQIQNKLASLLNTPSG